MKTRAPREGRPVTEELDVPEGPEDDAADDGRPRRPLNTLKTAEIDVARDRRSTMMSPIPAQMAESMAADRARPARDPAAPLPARPERTRKVGDSGGQRVPGMGSSMADVDAGVAPRRQRAAQLIDEARAALDADDLTRAVTAVEEALREADEAPPPGIVEVIEPARGLVTRVFATYVGPLSGIPVLAPRANEIARARLKERERAFLTRVDGMRTLEELFDGSGLGSTDALRVVARLLRTGAIRVI
jgi:hypothetical protein